MARSATRKVVVKEKRPKRTKTVQAEPVVPNLGSSASVIVNTITAMVSNINYIVMLLVVFYLIFSSGPRYTTGPIGRLINGTDNMISNYIRENPNDFTGLLLFSTNLPLVPTVYTLPYVAAAIAWVNMIPESTILEYYVQAIAFAVYLRVQNRNVRMLLGVGALIAYFAGWVVIAPNSMSVSSLPTSNTNFSFHSYRK